MNTLESVVEALNEYYKEFHQPRHLNVVDPLQVHSKLFKWARDFSQTPEKIIYLLETCLPKFEGFSTDWSFQSFVAFACLEALPWRDLKGIDGAWEQVVWIIVKYSMDMMYHISVHKNNVISYKTEDWLYQFCRPHFCPNPLLRLELFRFIRVLDMFTFGSSYESTLWNFIKTICEIHDDYSYLTVHEVPMCSVKDLMYIMYHSMSDMRKIIKQDVSESMRSHIIGSMLKITKMFVFLEYDRFQIYNAQPIGLTLYRRNPEWPSTDLHSQLECACLHLGLTPKYYFGYESRYELEDFMMLLYENKVLLNYLEGSYIAIENAAKCVDKEISFWQRNRIFNIIMRIEKFKIPKLLYQREMHGYEPLELKKLRYLSNIVYNGESEGYKLPPSISTEIESIASSRVIYIESNNRNDTDMNSENNAETSSGDSESSVDKIESIYREIDSSYDDTDSSEENERKIIRTNIAESSSDDDTDSSEENERKIIRANIALAVKCISKASRLEVRKWALDNP